MIAYIPFVILGALIALIFTILYLLQKKDHEEHRREQKASAQELKEYLHQRELESLQNARFANTILERLDRTLEEAQKTNRDNSIYLRMIFERVDKPPEGLT